MATSQLVVLPTYKLDSNLVLLPGIIYNVTFSRFKAATLLSRFRDLTSEFNLVRNLLNEYEFSSETAASKIANPQAFDEEDATSPEKISKEASDGIQKFVSFESKVKQEADARKAKYRTASAKDNDSDSESIHTLVGSEFDYLILAISPNLEKINEPDIKSLKSGGSASTSSRFQAEKENISTVVRIVGISDDTSTIKLTFQALTRGITIQGFKSKYPNEALVEVVDWNLQFARAKNRFIHLNQRVAELFGSIDNFVVSYRQALTNASNLAKKAKAGTVTGRDTGDLFTLNPLSNSLYLQLAGSKDFSLAYTSLQSIFSSFENNPKSVDSLAILRLVDLTCAIMPFPNHQKLTLLLKVSPNSRIDEMVLMINQLVNVFESIKENSEIINHWFFKEATNTQKASVIANQLKSIRLALEGLSALNDGKTPKSTPPNRQLIRKPPGGSQNGSSGGSGNSDSDSFDDDEGDDDLRFIRDFMKNKLPNIVGISNDAKRLIVKDFKRIRTAQPGNSDFHVIRNYLEVVVDMPWDKYVTKFQSNKDIDVEAAKAQLDLDHHGLEHVKKRLIQYLVVLKLLGMNAEAEFEAKRADHELLLKNSSSANLNNSKINEDNKEIENSGIVIANNDETRKAHESAREQNQKSKEQIKEEEMIKIRESAEALSSIQLLSSRNGKAPIILLAGPPGTGKTSLAKSIAKSLGRKFQRIALGGVRDEAEIRGHRRTYVGAMPGVIVQSLRKARSMNPVILLDEIDKVAGGGDGANKVHGDPAAALLEVLDPEQNSAFIDHYLGFAIDLSQVIFVCTANEPYEMSRPLLDRLEMIEVGAYDFNEKAIIGSKYLLPRQIKRNGFPSMDMVKIDELVMERIIIDYTREAGVRNFERKLATVCRNKAVEYAKSIGIGATSQGYDPIVDVTSLPKYLGIPFSPFSKEISGPFQANKFGVVNGLSYNTDGSGSVLVFELIGFQNDKQVSSLNMTGRLGQVLMESAKIGLTFVKLILYRDLLNLNDQFGEGGEMRPIDKLNGLEIHLHVPSGAIQKDGPSAGITMALLFLSLVIEKPVPEDIAMTGEITLRGSVLPIGGVKEKLLGAHFSGMKKVILPRENRKDVIKEYCLGINDDSELNELLVDNERGRDYARKEPEEYIYRKLGIRLYFASEFWDVIKVVWGDKLLVKVDQARTIEYHL